MSIRARIEMVVVENERVALKWTWSMWERSVHTQIDTVKAGGEWLRLNGHGRGGT